MKIRKIVSAFLCFLLCGCSISKNQTVSSIEEVEQVVKTKYDQKAYIQYPKTSYDKVNNEITKMIKMYENKAKKNNIHPDELNISYEITLQNSRYLSIVFYIYLCGNNAYDDIKTMVYDIKKDKLLSIEDIINEKQLINISNAMIDDFKNANLSIENDNFRIHSAPIMKNYQRFSITSNSIKFYFPKNTLFYDKTEFEYPIQKSKTVQVQNNEVLYEPFQKIDETKPMIALTFDDGPHKFNTKKILDILNKNQAKATFFVLGTNIENNEELLKSMIFQGNEIGNHTYSHKQLTKLSKKEIEEEIQQTENILQNNIHYCAKVLRPPYGSHNSLVDSCASSYRVVTWSLDTLDWKYRNTEKIVDEVISNVKEGDIILMHDLYKTTVDAVAIIIPKLKSMGYQFVTVSELYKYYGDKVRKS